jgi:hypothetical protein
MAGRFNVRFKRAVWFYEHAFRIGQDLKKSKNVR